MAELRAHNVGTGVMVDEKLAVFTGRRLTRVSTAPEDLEGCNAGAHASAASAAPPCPGGAGEIVEKQGGLGVTRVPPELTLPPSAKRLR